MEATNDNNLLFKELILISTLFKVSNINFRIIFIYQRSLSLILDETNPPAPFIIVYFLSLCFCRKMLDFLMRKRYKNYWKIGLFLVFCNQIFFTSFKTKSIKPISNSFLLKIIINFVIEYVIAKDLIRFVLLRMLA